MNSDGLDDFSSDSDLRRLLNGFITSSATGALLIQDDNVVEVSEAAARLLGYASKNEVIGLRLANILAPNSAVERISSDLNGETITFVRKGGWQINVELTVTPLPSSPGLNVVYIQEADSSQPDTDILESAATLLNKTLAEEMPGGFILADSCGKVVYMNRQAAAQTGYSAKELLSVDRLISPSEKEAISTYLQCTGSGVSSNIPEIKLVRKDGKEFWASISWHSVRDSRGRVQSICTVLSDITEHKETAEALSLAVERYRLLAENASDILWETDFNGVFTYVSPAVKHILGYVPESCIGKKLFRYIDASEVKHHEVFLKDFLNIVRESPKGLVEVKMLRKDKTSVWMEVSWSIIRFNGAPIGFHGIARDISKRKLAEKALKESEEQFRTLIGNLPDVVYRCDCDSDWTMTLLSSAIQDLVGYPSSDFVGGGVRSYDSIIHPEDRSLVSDTINSAVEKQEPFTIVYRVIHADGSIRWVQERGQGIFDTDNKLLWLDGVISDITEQREIENAWIKAHDDMQRAYQLQQQFLNNVTHEIRTPLTAIQGYAKMIIEGLSGPVADEQASLLKKMLVCSDDLLSIVNGVLEIARLKSGIIGIKPKVCSTKTIVEKCILAVSPQFTAKGLMINVDSSACSGIQGIYDEEKLTMIVTNLLSNAVKFTDEGSIEVIMSCDANGAEIIIADTGMGIAQPDLGCIFDEFQQLDYPKKHKPNGFGIGLAIVATMVEKIGASLTVSSRKGVGTAFTLQVPSLDPNS